MVQTVEKVNLAMGGINLVESSCGRGVAQLGSALGLGPRGRWFESSRPDHLYFWALHQKRGALKPFNDHIQLLCYLV